MIRNIYSNRIVGFGALTFVHLAGNVVQAAQLAGGHPYLVDVFTTADSPITGEATIRRHQNYMKMELQVYELDGIQRIEAKLSKGLAADPKQAKRVVLQRIQQLDEQATASIQNAAVGLAKSMQYGVDRYPAIVFDGKVVVYGLADLNTALDHYLAWKAGARP